MGLSAEDMESLSPWYTVVGVWPETKERYVTQMTAQTPRQAEDMAQFEAKQRGGVLWVSAVFEGRIYAVDTYATFADDPDRTPEAQF